MTGTRIPGPVCFILFALRWCFSWELMLAPSEARATLAGLERVVVLAVVVWHFSPTSKTRFMDMARKLEAAKVESNYATSVGVRWRMYEEAIKGMIEHPAFGTGLGSSIPHWRSVWTELGKNISPETQRAFADITNPHGDFLLTGIETGNVGTMIMVWLLAGFIRTGWNRISTPGGITVIMGVSVFSTALVNAPFPDAALGMTLFWLPAVSAAAGKRLSHE